MESFQDFSLFVLASDVIVSFKVTIRCHSHLKNQTIYHSTRDGFLRNDDAVLPETYSCWITLREIKIFKLENYRLECDFLLSYYKSTFCLFIYRII